MKLGEFWHGVFREISGLRATAFLVPLQDLVKRFAMSLVLLGEHALAWA